MRKVGTALAGASLLVLALTFGTWVQAGPSYTLLPTFSDASAALHAGRVVATSKTISCSALLVDEVHGIVDPLICQFCLPPAIAHLPQIRS